VPAVADELNDEAKGIGAAEFRPTDIIPARRIPMPLRDHFHPPLDEMRHWEGFHGQWPGEIVRTLLDKLPERYFAEPRVHPGSSAEIDVATFHEPADVPGGNGRQAQGGLATAVWAPPRPRFSVVTDLPASDEYEVQVFDAGRNCRLVAAIEIISPAHKDRPEHRRAFVAKCAALLQKRVSVMMIDLVTTRKFNLYHDLLELIGQTEPALGAFGQPIYAVACRGTKQDPASLLENWGEILEIGRPLPTLPLWLADDFAIPVELEEAYEETCRVLRIP
jgi:hypothetical protein